jgi:hypothetical protein
MKKIVFGQTILWMVESMKTCEAFMRINLDCINIAKVLMLPKELKNMKIILYFYTRNMHLDPHLQGAMLIG